MYRTPPTGHDHVTVSVPTLRTGEHDITDCQSSTMDAKAPGRRAFSASPALVHCKQQRRRFRLGLIILAAMSGHPPRAARSNSSIQFRLVCLGAGPVAFGPGRMRALGYPAARYRWSQVTKV
jgi:hypothetical protein